MRALRGLKGIKLTHRVIKRLTVTVSNINTSNVDVELRNLVEEPTDIE